MNTGIENAKVGIDRVVLGVPTIKPLKIQDGETPPKELIEANHAAIKKSAHEMLYIKGMITLDPDEYVVKPTDCPTLKRYLVKEKESGDVYCDFLLGKAGKVFVTNFGFNPSKITIDQRGHIVDLLSVCFNYGYHELYELGVVSRIEFFVDVEGIELSNYVLLDAGRKKSGHYKDTTYTGAKGGALVITKYNKADELGIDGKLVRFEVRLSRRDLHIPDLYSIENPFRNAIVLEVEQLKAIALKMGVEKHMPVLMKGNWREVFKNKSAREKFITLARESAPKWWKPDQFWSEHKTLLKGLHPHVFN